ncbi:hypothetical protein SSX86_012910 [Deinandra increscens subsp. villosa]|uniref:Uncharacterized protein n=1 Tax=Deinandra increscens subsp. villosa TaxID=3103831 RepID=A0AAP0D5I2_9ASTR
MRCKKHYTDLSSIVGVCACCLRERLLSLIAAQEQAEAQARNLDGKHRNSEKNPAFSSSVSPYIHNREQNQSAGVAAWSDSNRRNDHHHPYPSAAPRHRHSVSDQLFDRTPQIGPNSGGRNTGVDSNKKRSFIRLFWFPNIFRSGNRKTDVDSVSDPGEPDSTFGEQCVAGNATSSLPSIGHGSRQRRKQPVYIDESTVTGGFRRQYCRDRGMSPVRSSDVDGADVEELNNSTTESWKNTPRRTPARRGGGGGHVRNLSSLTFCLSPLVRASPNRQWNQNGLPPDGVMSGEIRAPVKAHLSNAKGFDANRSRKLVDHGRPNRNR